jgi:cardiolipin synthase C
MALLRVFLILLAVLGLSLLTLRVLYPLPDRAEIEATTAPAASDETRIGAAVLAGEARHPGLSGIIPLAGGNEAFAARVLLARGAEQTLDVQYYIWQADTTGYLLLDELRAAAERGVQVRLLLDDNGIPGLDAELASLDALPNVEVRLFNPFTLRSPKLLSYGFDFPRLNHRMHNKSFTADGAVTIVGGRNVGDIYFAFGPDVHYIDTEVLVAGPAAALVAAAFDDYWNSESAFPAGLILAPAPDGAAKLADAVAAANESAAAVPYAAAISDSPLMRNLLAGLDGMEWTQVSFVTDDPAKGLGQAGEDGLLIDRLNALLSAEGAGATDRVDLISAYFVPGAKGTASLADLAARGVEVRVLTNAQEATDVLTVHGSYVEYRDDLLAAGVRLFELKADPLAPPQENDFARLLSGSASSLHSKVFAIDDAWVFIGSFNFDPRSARLNTEMGFLIESPALARAVAAAMDNVGAQDAYEVRLGPDRRLAWVEQGPDGAELVLTTEPNTTWLSRLVVRIIGVLPVEWMM